MHENMYYTYGKSVNSAIIIVSKYLSLHNLLSLCKVGQDRYVPPLCDCNCLVKDCLFVDK